MQRCWPAAAPGADQLSVARGHVATDHFPTFTVKRGGSSHCQLAGRSSLPPPPNKPTQTPLPWPPQHPSDVENNLQPAQEAHRPCCSPPGRVLSRLRSPTGTQGASLDPPLSPRHPVLPRPSSRHRTKTICVSVCLPRPWETPAGKEHTAPASQHPEEPGSAVQTLPAPRPAKPTPHCSGRVLCAGSPRPGSH